MKIMTQYIDKDALVAKIEELDNFWHLSKSASGLTFVEKLLSSLDTLEVKEEILNKEGKTKLMRKCVHKAYKRGYDMGVLQTTNKMNHNTKEVDLDKECSKYFEDNNLCVHDDYIRFAKHFFELGLKAQKGE